MPSTVPGRFSVGTSPPCGNTEPLDRRANRAFRDDTPSAPAPSRALYAVTHLDLAPVDEARGTTALQHLVDAARKSPGNLRFEAWQQANRPNHFNLIASWSSRASLDEFTHSAAAREYRAIVAPLIGSPYDERLYQRLDTK